MQLLIGWLILILGGFLYLGQVISTTNFSLAQRLGLQESPDHSDPILQRAERYVAYWDLVVLGWFPIAGILMILDYQYWPAIALISAGIYFDTSGREAAKILSFRHEGVRLGTQKQQKLFFATYFCMAGLACLVIVYALYDIVRA
ncbi:MAG: hypothetical protein GKR91_11245 [Pseudomonadales bacterium]|nr:hypothetical protein [Pseudomonadales bacterium]